MTLPVLIAVATFLRWRYITEVQPYPDEFVTLLAVQAILKHGLPVLPSGLFYEHGLLFSYASAAVTILAGFSRETVRAVSLGFGIVTVWLTWHLGRRWLSSSAGMIAAAVVAVAPSAVLWGGRARMYTLLQVWVLLVVGLALGGAIDGRRWWRWLALLSLLAAGLTHFVSLTLVPPLVSGMVLLGWLAARSSNGRAWWRRQALPPHRFDRLVWLEAAGLVGVVVLSLLVKRLGQPRSIAPLEASGAGVLAGIRQVLEIYAALPTDLSAGWQAVAQFFISPEAIWMSALATIAVVSAVIGVLRPNAVSTASDVVCSRVHRRNLAVLFMGWLIAGTTLEMVLLVTPERRDEKYLFMLLPFLALVAADGLTRLGHLAQRVSVAVRQRPSVQKVWRGSEGKGVTAHTTARAYIGKVPSLIACVLVIVTLWPMSAALLARSGPDYDMAFAYVREHWREGDAILTSTPAAAGIYLGHNDFYAMQDPGYSYRLLPDGDRWVDRWLGSPWLATDAQLHSVLSAPRRVWLVFERWGLTTEYFAPLTLQRLLAMTEFVREDNGIIVLRSRPGSDLVPDLPPNPVSVNFADQVTLIGYDCAPADDTQRGDWIVTLYWQAQRPLPYDYTVFVHLRDAEGRTVAQADHLPLAPIYPPTLWPPGETIRERSRLTLPETMPAGLHSLWVGLYRLDTLERLPIVGDTSGENAAVLPVRDSRQPQTHHQVGGSCSSNAHAAFQRG